MSWRVPAGDERLAEYYCDDAGPGLRNKFDGFLEFRRRRPQPWPYRYVALLDDDVYLRPGELSRFFAICDEHQLYLAQPALRWFTNTTLNALVRNPICTLRSVSCVEVMAPCFSTAALQNLLHTFGWTRSTWGVNWAWGCLPEGREPLHVVCLLEGRERLHVVDAVSMEHMRTAEGRPTAFYRKLESAGSQEHVFRAGLPRALARSLMLLFEQLKVIVRARQKLQRRLRKYRAPTGRRGDSCMARP